MLPSDAPPDAPADADPGHDGLTVLWTPLGADGPAVVRASGRVFEALVAARDRRRPLVLHHAALEVRLSGTVRVVEMTPVWGQPAGDRGVLAEGPVGSRLLGRSRFFRYEVRCRPVGPTTGARRPGTPTDRANGPDRTRRHDLPDAGPAATARARAVLDAAAEVPLPVWGRRAPGTAEMWNSNSVVAYLLARVGADLGAARPPTGGRAPGWSAGLALAARRDAGAPSTDRDGTGRRGATADPTRHR